MSMNETEYSEEHEAYLREHEDIQPDEDYEMPLRKSDSNKLWVLANGKCSICKLSLFREEDSGTNLGAECHISAHAEDQPRYDKKLSDFQRDKSYNNAILLCCNCHKIIDNPENTQYTIEELHRIKKEHEIEVHTSKKHSESFEKDKQHELLESIVNHNKIEDKRRQKEKLEQEEIIKNEERKAHAKNDLYPALEFFKNELNLNTFPISLNKVTHRYSNDAEEHLQNGYLKTSWKYKEERNRFIGSFNPMVEDFVKHTVLKIIGEINQKMPSLIEWNGTGEAPLRYYYPKDLYSDVTNVVMGSYLRILDIEKFFFVMPCGENKWWAKNQFVFAQSDNKDEMLIVTQIVIDVLKDALKGSPFVEIKECLEDIKENDRLFVNSVGAILKKIEKGIPLEGKCEDC